MVAPLVGSFQPKAITGGATFHNTVRADNTRVSFSLAACTLAGMQFCLHKSFSVIMIRAGEE
jgi:glutamyl-tRNA reductase